MKATLTSIYILFIAIFALSIFYSYPAMLKKLPQGAHRWRQTDCWAMTQNYQQFHLPFFEPEIYNLEAVNGKAAGEFPLFYFMAAQFNQPAFALRLMHTLLFLISIFAIYFIAFSFLKRRLLAIFCALLFFTSPLLVFYGNNFLSDVPALSVALVGWAFFFNSSKQKNFTLYFACIFFAFATLLKASEAFNYFIAFIFLAQTQKINFKQIIPFSAVFIPVLWYGYAKTYNIENHDTYYFLSVFPIWKLSLHEIGLVIWRMFVSWSNNYFWRPTSIILIFSIYFLIKHAQKLDKELRSIVLSSFLAIVVYILFFYQKLIEHEYYYVLFFIFVLFLVIACLKMYNNFQAENVFTHTFLFLFLLPNIIFCKNFIAQKLTNNMPNGNLSSIEMQDFLLKNEVTDNKIVVSLPDGSPNQTLSQLKRKGFTEYNDYLQILKNKNADFIVLGNDSWKQETKLKPYLNDSIGYFNGITLYKIK